MSKIVLLKSRPASDTSRRKRPSTTLFMHIRQTTLIASVPQTKRKAS